MRAAAMLESTASPTTRESTATRTGGATRTTVRVLGALAAFAGLEHGIGEISQGWKAPPAVVFESWPDVDAFGPLDGEPAMSLVPDLMVSGVLTVVVSLLLGVTAVRADRAHLGATLIGLSVVLLLVGGGFGPPLLGVAVGLLALKLDGSPGRTRPPGPVSGLVGRTYPWPLTVAAGCFLGLVPGTALLHQVVDRDLSTLVAALSLGAFAGTGLALWSARARDRTDDAPRRGVTS